MIDKEIVTSRYTLIVSATTGKQYIKDSRDNERNGRVEDYTRGIQFTRVNIKPYCASVKIFVNQGWRWADPIAYHEDRVLFEYEMPNGRMYYQEWQTEYGGSFEYVRTINRKNPPTIWRDVEFCNE
jgi:hypothetical protein